MCLGVGAVCPNDVDAHGGVLTIFGGSWGPKRVVWPVACKADKPWLVWRGNGSCGPGMFGHHDLGEVFVALVGLGSPFLRRR